MEYDEEMIKKVLNKSKHQEEFREAINHLTELLQMPIQEIITICLKLKTVLVATAKEFDAYSPDFNKEKAKELADQIENSFINTLLANLMNVFNISPNRMRERIEETIKQYNNINKQKEGD